MEKHLVCEGALCKCIYGNTPDKLMVKTQKKRYVSGESGRLIATDKEIGKPFEKNTFGSCSKQRKNPPCKLIVTEWKKTYEKVIMKDNGGKILLEDSIATCSIGGSGCIKILFHGQEIELTKANFNNYDPIIMQSINPLVDMQEFIENINEIEDIIEIIDQ